MGFYVLIVNLCCGYTKLELIKSNGGVVQAVKDPP